jgi:hypothetical protein
MMSDDKPEWLKDMQILRAQPGDVVVLRHGGILSEAAIASLKRAFHSLLPEYVKVAVLEEGMDIGIIRGGSDE